MNAAAEEEISPLESYSKDLEEVQQKAIEAGTNFSQEVTNSLTQNIGEKSLTSCS